MFREYYYIFKKNVYWLNKINIQNDRYCITVLVELGNKICILYGKISKTHDKTYLFHDKISKTYDKLVLNMTNYVLIVIRIFLLNFLLEK